jgi:hypothetical protein
LVLTLALAAGSPAPARAAGCPNEAIRAEQGEKALALPDCRAYEVVSASQSSPTTTGNGRFLAAFNGERFTYASWNPYPGSGNEALSYVAVRGPEGWNVMNPVPPQNGAQTSIFFRCTPSFIGDRELDHVVLADGFRTEGAAPEEAGEECLGDDPPVASGEGRGTSNLFRTDPLGSSYQLLNPTPAGVQEQNSVPQAYNPDLSTFVFSEPAQLTPDAPTPVTEGYNREENLYIWHEGTLRYLAYLPDGTPIPAFMANGGEEFSSGGHGNISVITHAISDDGERVFFEHESKIYLREHALREQSAVSGGACTEPAKACTIPIDVSEEGPSEYGFGGGRSRYGRHFQFATPDGSRVFFTDWRKLTPDSTAEGPSKNEYGELRNEKPDLYEYDVATGVTRDLTVDNVEPANVRGFSGASDDGNYLYFAAYANLTGAEQNSNGDTAIADRANLYLWHAGTITYIATMEGGAEVATGGESSDWQESPAAGSALEGGRYLNTGNLSARFPANGKFLVFQSAANLTGFEPAPAEPGDCPYTSGHVLSGPEAHCEEVYIYEAESGHLACASCSPTGAAPTGEVQSGQLPYSTWDYASPHYLPRAVSETGTVFFSTQNALLPQDANETEDVYEYEHGALYLLSAGADGDSAAFWDASADGNNVFFNDGRSLVGRDDDGGNSLYDARVGGGFAEPPPLPGCEAEACRGASSSKGGEAAAGTSTFVGPGNQVEAHKRDCSIVAKRATKLSRNAKKLRRDAKKLRRQSKKASGRRAARLRHRAAHLHHGSVHFAKKAHKSSRQAKTCRRSNRGAK